MPSSIRTPILTSKTKAGVDMSPQSSQDSNKYDKPLPPSPLKANFRSTTAKPQALAPNSKIPKPILKKPSFFNLASKTGFSSRLKTSQSTTFAPPPKESPTSSQDSPKAPPPTESPKADNQSIDSQSSTSSPAIPIGTPVITIRDKLTGTLRFLGTTDFKEGLWAGVELDNKGTGKNDGSVSGKRYFQCPPQTGIFIDARAIRPRGRLPALNKGVVPPPSKLIPDKMSSFEKPTLKSKKSMPALQNRTLKANPPKDVSIPTPSSAGSSSTIAKKPSLPQLSPSVMSNAQMKKIEEIVTPPILPSKDLSGVENDLGQYLSSDNANPTLIIKNLLSQLNSCQKQNELLQVRINRKKAQQEATRVLRNELTGRTNRRGSFSTTASTVVSEPLENGTSPTKASKVAQNGKEVNGSSGSNDPLNKEAAVVKTLELQNVQTELAELQAKVASKDETIGELRSELMRARSSSRLNRRRSDEQGASEHIEKLTNELESLKQDAAEEVSALQAQIGELKRQRDSTQSLGDPNSASNELLKLRLKLEESLSYSRRLEKMRDEISSKSQNEIQILKQQMNRQMEQNPGSKAMRNSNNDQFEHEASRSLIDQLVSKNESLQQRIRELEAYNGDFDGVPWRQYEELKEEKESYLASVESLQKEREILLSDISELKSSLGRNDGKETLSDNSDKDASKPDIFQLEERIRQLEDELVSAQAYQQKHISGTLTSDDIHQNLEKELFRSHNNIVKLEARCRAAEDRGYQLAETNNQLSADLQTLEEDNWNMNDLIRDLQDETAQLTSQVDSLTNRVSQLDAALEVAASDSDAVRHLQNVLHQMEELEASFKTDSQYLYNMINEQDEELARLADRELELQEHIEMLESEIESYKDPLFSHSYFESESGLNSPGLGNGLLEPGSYCQHCNQTGNHLESCPLINVGYSQDLSRSVSAGTRKSSRLLSDNDF